MSILHGQKINGLSLNIPQYRNVDTAMMISTQQVNANWIALVPVIIVERSTLRLIHNDGDWESSMNNIIKSIVTAKSFDSKVFLKPHLVLGNRSKGSSDLTGKATWRGQIKAPSDHAWEILEREYRTYILQLAQVAQDHQVELFSIGTELQKFVKHRPQFWDSLIQEVRAVYHGDLTYSPNWDEYKATPFWSDLDYIGVDAYFSLSKKKTPKVKQLKKKWNGIKRELSELHKTYERSIILTEYGYRNIAYAGHHPWEHINQRDTAPDDLGQQHLFIALYESLWQEPWIAGGFLWQWFSSPVEKGNTDFTVQNKPALQVVRRWYTQGSIDEKGNRR